LFEKDAVEFGRRTNAAPVTTRKHYGRERESDAKDGEVFERDTLLRGFFRGQDIVEPAIQGENMSRWIERKQRIRHPERIELNG
jgi:hypothetical protein